MQQRLIAVLALCTLALTVTVEPDIGQQPSDNRVTIELYYESLCPFCHKFMTEQLQLVLALPVFTSLSIGDLGYCRLQALSLRQC